MNAFAYIKEYVTARDVAEHYGLKVTRSGMICCPFHADKHPSMKVDDRYYCFGCGATGDAIDLVGKLLGLSPYESMLRIAADFGIELGNAKRIEKFKIIPIQSKKKMTSDLQKWRLKAIHVLLDYRRQLRDWRVVYSPTNEGDEWHPKFQESLALYDKVNYWLDVLVYGEDDNKKLLYKQIQSEVEKLEKRFKR